MLRFSPCPVCEAPVLLPLPPAPSLPQVKLEMRSYFLSYLDRCGGWGLLRDGVAGGCWMGWGLLRGVAMVVRCCCVLLCVRCEP